MGDSFFEAQTEQSRVKATIVSEYFKQWSKVMVTNVKTHGARYSTDKIIYLDLYSGPGTYEDGSFSTPLLILNHAVSDTELQKYLLCVFNDADETSIGKLEKTVKDLPGIQTLSHAPEFYHGEVDAEMVKVLQTTNMPPTLLFADPFGYKGLSLDLINSVLKDFGGESIFFFNYNRTQAAIKNSKVEGHIDALFGKERADKLREIENGSGDKEEDILVALLLALTEKYGKYFCLFKFPSVKKDITSHYLVYVTKHQLGYKIMQSTMAKYSDYEDEYGVASFRCDPTAIHQKSIFNPLKELALELSKEFQGKSMILDEFWVEHSIATNYVRKNYVEAVKLLADEGLVTFSGTIPKQRKHCGENTVVCFK